MAQTNPLNPSNQPGTPSKKRKDAPSQPSNLPTANKKQKTQAQSFSQRQRDARILSTQTTSAAFSNGALDVDKFVKAREYEIQALEQGMQRSRKAQNRGSFQQVPNELRRRTAAHDVKRVPKRLRAKRRKEMNEDNTPTVTAKKRKPTRHMRLRLETAKKLRALGSQKKAAKEKVKDEAEKVRVINPNASTNQADKPAPTESPKKGSKVKVRDPRVKRQPTLAKPPVPKARFRKRQIHKSWLPTHLFHAKRAHMTPPSAPLWRFAIPLTPTQKSYRPTHRASHERGAVAWDTSYMATIGLEGQQRSVKGMLKALGVEDGWLSGSNGVRWMRGTRVLETSLHEREKPHHLIAPVTIVWCVLTSDGEKEVDQEKSKRKLFLRVHPSAFFQLWEEVVRLGKVAKPTVSVEDLRFEVGSIEITGPGSTEALLGALWPIRPESGSAQQPQAEESVGQVWSNLAGVTGPAILPQGALLGFDIQDPRLRHPPRTIKLPQQTQYDQNQLVTLLSSWPVDDAQRPAQIFDRTARLRGSKLPSQKAVNRRKGLAKAGSYPDALPTDPRIPVLLYASSSPNTTVSKKTQHQSTWTLLAPWKTINAIWYSIIYYPLSTGLQPRFGGLAEKQQLAFEAGVPWFPGDFPGTKAGWEWEIVERRKRWEEWMKRPKSKRASFQKVDLGGGRKGEVGVGWACDWALLLGETGGSGNGDKPDVTMVDIDCTMEKSCEENSKSEKALEQKEKGPATTPPPSKPENLSQLPSSQAVGLLKPTSTPPAASISLGGKLITVSVTLLTRGVPQTCARIYRLPSASTQPDLRKDWLALLPSKQPKRKQRSDPKHGLPRLPKHAPPHIVQQRLAQSLLEPPKAGEDSYPTCPGQEDLIGFVTTGNFNLAEGQGTGIGNLLVAKVLDQQAGHDGQEGRLCVVRNSGQDVGRLARWDVV